MRVNEYYPNGEINNRKQEFYQWVLSVRNDTVPAKAKDGEDEPTWIQIPEQFIINSSGHPIEDIVAETYPNFIERQHDDEYLKKQAILTPRNDNVDVINTYMFNKLAAMLVPSCFVIFDLEPLSLSFDFVFSSEIFKSFPCLS
ncbi:ATP-dependent DNA helicase PIF1-like protein [Tanacetum coccineum]